MTEDTDARRLWIALALIVGLMVVEVVAGILANSLALLSDAAHMLTDAAALVLVAGRDPARGARPRGGNLTFGLKRAEILSAQANGVTLLVLAVLIVYGGIRRIVSPPDAGRRRDGGRRARRRRREPGRDACSSRRRTARA